jgi:hypothetical protein
MKRLILYTCGWFLAFHGFAQVSPATFKPAISRALFHSKLDEAQKALLAADGLKDANLTPYPDEELNLQLTYNATNRIDEWQEKTELDEKLDHQEKIRQLRGMGEMLTAYASVMRGTKMNSKTLQWNHLPMMIDGYEQALELDVQNKEITAALTLLPYRGALLLASNIAFIQNPGAENTKQYLLLKYLDDNPDLVLIELGRYPNYNYPFADSLIALAARRMPDQVITYAQAKQTEIAKKIRSNEDPLVKLLVSLARDNQGQLYMPFLDQLYAGTLTREEIARAIKDSSSYYSLLVQTQIQNAIRSQKGEQVTSAKAVSDMLKRKSMDVYVNTINGLHDSPANIRFKNIQGLGPEELYYLIVMNEAEIYTSSYMYVFRRIFEVMPVKSSDSILARVHYDRYKKFLTMASNYNTLDVFLDSMSIESSTRLMTDFVNNLDKGTGEDDIEDAVDVANAYATIADPEIRKLMLDQVERNLQMAIANNNKKAMTIYHLEKLIMESSDTTSTVNLSDSLGILPIYNVKNDYLKDEQGRIVMQMYFYGDGAGKGSFNTLMGLMGDRNMWKMTATPQWVQWTSLNTAVPFVLFANRALDEEKDLDEQAQHALIAWMGENGFKPSITVHRGHSYYLKYTIEKLLPSSKVVVLGSCGAYHNLADILKISPEAYIIASKQVGYGVINIQLFMYLINELKRGKDVAWPTMMEDVARNVGSGRKSDFDDYIFPHKNLGAIFIKAYKQAMGSEG